MDRRVSFALVLFAVFAFGFIQWRASQRAAEVARQRATEPVAPAAPPAPPAPVVPAAGGGEYAATPDAPVDDRIEVQTDLLYARFTNRGAALLELRLKKHFPAAGVAGDTAREGEVANWLPLLFDPAPELPSLALFRNDPNPQPGVLALDRAAWNVARTPLPDGEEIVFTLDDGGGRRFEKRLRFRTGAYDFDVDLSFANLREGPAQGSDSYRFVAVGAVAEVSHGGTTGGVVAFTSLPDESAHLDLAPAKALEDGPRSRPLAREGLAPIFGAANNYFALAVLPAPETLARIDNVTAGRVLDAPHLAKLVAARAKERGGALDPGEIAQLRAQSYVNVRSEAYLRVPFPAREAPPLRMQFRFYGGPRSPAVIDATPGLEPLAVLYEVQYGSKTWLRWINRLLLTWMRWMHALTGNWGVAIILLTVTVKVLLFPLNRLQSRTMEQFQKKMKLLQPELDALKKKFKGGDAASKQKFAQEQQRLMREHGVRPPVFGCLIVFLQMPVWFGLFQIMPTAPELRQQPFFGWIDDLSVADVVPLPFALPGGFQLHLLPILMVAAWMLQNRMMPKPADPQQAQMQKMMNFFPLIFGVMLYGYASGQSLYMLTNSLLGMLQMKLLKVTPTN